MIFFNRNLCVLFVLIIVSSNSWAQSINNIGLPSYRSCVSIGKTNFDYTTCLTSRKENKHRAAKALLTNNCDQKVEVIVGFTGEFIYANNQPKDVTLLQGTTSRVFLDPGKSEEVMMCDAKLDSGKLNIVEITGREIEKEEESVETNNSFPTSSSSNAGNRSFSSGSRTSFSSTSYSSNTITTIDGSLMESRTSTNNSSLNKPTGNTTEQLSMNTNSPDNRTKLNDIHEKNQINRLKREMEFQAFQEKMNKQQEEIRKNRIALETASTEATNQIANGNYLEGASVYANELARQGNAGAAYGTLAVGMAAEVWSMVATEKKKKKEAEERRLAQERELARQEQQRIDLIQKQKIEFFRIAQEESSKIMKQIKIRTEFVEEKIEHSKTFNLYSNNVTPIYLFYLEVEKNHKDFKDSISFPDIAEFKYNKTPELIFSPIIAVNPLSNGEYPFLENIHMKIRQKYFKDTNKKYKIYNWSKDKNEIYDIYSKETEKATSKGFIIKIPSEEVVVLNESKVSSNSPYWESGSNITGKESSKSINYWDDTSEKDSIQTPIINKTDYWKN
ncbi:hypothetical protein [Formosa haliotis]|uniref:hypothetical protein n=1 Tax=Formosa haliotis TaxID=1555194 RepID=UPI000826DAD2|nr:hypothetical protein [Formosa haliotis]